MAAWCGWRRQHGALDGERRAADSQVPLGRNGPGASSPCRTPVTREPVIEPGFEIAGSARQHGVADEDVRHAARMALREVDQGGRVFLIGPDRTGQLLEVVVLDPDGEPVGIHAMSLRTKFFNLL